MGRGLLAKTIEAAGLVIVGMALLGGLEKPDPRKELFTLGFGSLVFVVGWLLEPRTR